MNPLLLAVVEFDMPYVYAAVAVFFATLFGVWLLCKGKEDVDVVQEGFARAGGGAVEIGFKHLDDVLFAMAGGSIKRVKQAAIPLIKEYFTSEDGPARLVRDIVLHCYHKIRNHPKYGNEVRQAVVSAALGFDPADQKKDLDFAKAGGRLEKIGWNKSAKASYALAVKDFKTMTDEVVSLCNEVLEDNGEKEIALRVSRTTVDVLFNDPKYRDQVMPVLREYVAKDDARIAADKAKMMVEARAAIAQEDAAKKSAA